MSPHRYQVLEVRDFTSVGASVPPWATDVLKGVKLPGFREVERAPTRPPVALLLK